MTPHSSVDLAGAASPLLFPPPLSQPSFCPTFVVFGPTRYQETPSVHHQSTRYQLAAILIRQALVKQVNWTMSTERHTHASPAESVVELIAPRTLSPIPDSACTQEKRKKVTKTQHVHRYDFMIMRPVEPQRRLLRLMVPRSTAHFIVRADYATKHTMDDSKHSLDTSYDAGGTIVRSGRVVSVSHIDR